MADIQKGYGSFLSGKFLFLSCLFVAMIGGLATPASQELALRLLPDQPLGMSIVMTAGLGFFVRYGLDRRWLFAVAVESQPAERRKILIHGASGIGAALLLRAMERVAWMIWNDLEGKYSGAGAGIARGNVINTSGWKICVRRWPAWKGGCP